MNCTDCKYKVRGTVVSLLRSGRKHELSPASERELARMVTSQPKTTIKQVRYTLEASWRQLSVFTSTRAERLPCKKRVLAPDAAPESWTEVCCWSHGQGSVQLREEMVCQEGTRAYSAMRSQRLLCPTSVFRNIHLQWWRWGLYPDVWSAHSGTADLREAKRRHQQTLERNLDLIYQLVKYYLYGWFCTFTKVIF